MYCQGNGQTYIIKAMNWASGRNQRCYSSIYIFLRHMMIRVLYLPHQCVQDLDFKGAMGNDLESSTILGGHLYLQIELVD